MLDQIKKEILPYSLKFMTRRRKKIRDEAKEKLTKGEIDKLLGGDGKDCDEKVERYFFSNPFCFTKEQVDGLKSEAENFCKTISESISSVVGENVVIEVAEIEQNNYEYFISFLYSKNALFLFNDRQKRTVALALPDILMLRLLEHFVPKDVARNKYKRNEDGRFVNHVDWYDKSEYAAAKKIANRLLKKPLNEKIFKKAGLKFSFRRFEDDRKFFYASGFEENGIIIKMNFAIDGQKMNSSLWEVYLWIPSRTLKGKGDCYLDKAARKEKQARRRSMRKNLDKAQIPIKVVLGETSMTLKELRNFGKDSVVELDKLCGEPVEVQANGVVIAKAEVVILEEGYAIKIMEVYR